MKKRLAQDDRIPYEPCEGGPGHVHQLTGTGTAAYGISNDWRCSLTGKTWRDVVIMRRPEWLAQVVQ